MTGANAPDGAAAVAAAGAAAAAVAAGENAAGGLFTWSSLLLGLAGTTGLTILGGLFALFYFQRTLIYPSNLPPGSRTSVAKPDEFGLSHFEDLMLPSLDGTLLHMYLITRPTEAETRAAPTLLLLHANAGNMGHRLYIARVFHSVFQCNILLLSYRGYGFSHGEPSEAGIRQDARAALKYLQQHKDIDSTQLVAYGQSLGGAVAIDLVANNPGVFRALIVENTFTTLPEVARQMLPFLGPLVGLCTEKWNSRDAIRRVTVPTLILVGTEDTLVPPGMSEQLFAAAGAPAENKTLARIEGGTHNDTIAAPSYFTRVAHFWNAHIKPLIFNAI